MLCINDGTCTCKCSNASVKATACKVVPSCIIQRDCGPSDYAGKTVSVYPSCIVMMASGPKAVHMSMETCNQHATSSVSGMNNKKGCSMSFGSLVHAEHLPTAPPSAAKLWNGLEFCCSKHLAEQRADDLLSYMRSACHGIMSSATLCAVEWCFSRQAK